MAFNLIIGRARSYWIGLPLAGKCFLVAAALFLAAGFSFGLVGRHFWATTYRSEEPFAVFCFDVFRYCTFGATLALIVFYFFCRKK